MKQEIAPGSTIRQIIIVTQPETEYVLEVSADAHVTYCFIVTESASITCTISLKGPGAYVQFYAIYLLEADQTCTIITNQEHVCPQATSSVLIKGILKDNARFEHRGLIAIAPEAVGSVAYQHTKNIMLSPYARAWAQPSLQVLTHDVHCAHGSATGYLDEDQLYYMQARGISLQEAKTLLLKGFFADILQEVGDPAIEGKINEKIHEQT